MEEERDQKIHWRQESSLFVQKRMGERKNRTEEDTGGKQVIRIKGGRPKKKNTRLGKHSERYLRRGTAE